MSYCAARHEHRPYWGSRCRDVVSPGGYAGCASLRQPGTGIVMRVPSVVGEGERQLRSLTYPQTFFPLSTTLRYLDFFSSTDLDTLSG